MTEAEWATCTEPNPLVYFLHDKASERKQWLFACASVRRVWRRLPDPRSRRAVETTERFIEGEAGAEERDAARREAEAAEDDAIRGGRFTEGERAAVGTALPWLWTPSPWPCVGSVVETAACAAAQGAEPAGKGRKERERNWIQGITKEALAQCVLFRDIAGNPFRPVALDPAWLTPTVQALAQAAYEDRVLPSGELDLARLKVLADALEEAGCTEAALLDHLRSSGPHVRGCWAVDLVLARR
jgi:hypothetical protein